jgi:hypothetical protein
MSPASRTAAALDDLYRVAGKVAGRIYRCLTGHGDGLGRDEVYTAFP